MKELIEIQRENIRIWNELKEVPATAKKKIPGGRLKGMTDIKPQWRLQIMTEQFGIIGIGWYYEIKRTWTEEYNKEVSAYVEVNLFIKDEDKWSMPISGIGGSMLLAAERNGLHHSDEAYKMATTDALSVAMKQLGVAADVYMGLSDSKYDKTVENKKELATNYQKNILKDLVVKLEPINQKAVNAISEELTNKELTSEHASKLINRANDILKEVK